MTAKNHFEGKSGIVTDLLRDLTDEQVTEQREYFEQMLAEAHTSFSKFRIGNLLGAAFKEEKIRHGQSQSGTTAPA